MEQTDQSTDEWRNSRDCEWITIEKKNEKKKFLKYLFYFSELFIFNNAKG